MQVGDLVLYIGNKTPHWKRKDIGVVVKLGRGINPFVEAAFPTWDGINWYHRDNLELLNASR